MAKDRPLAFDGNFVGLVREMAAAARHLDETPEHQEWTMEQMDAVDDVRLAALRLSESAEAIIEGFRGR